eukprot:COSAG03_NODE_2050_length_3179_cov_74.511673_4_plen_149_part_00
MKDGGKEGRGGREGGRERERETWTRGAEVVLRLHFLHAFCMLLLRQLPLLTQLLQCTELRDTENRTERNRQREGGGGGGGGRRETCSVESSRHIAKLSPGAGLGERIGGAAVFHETLREQRESESQRGRGRETDSERERDRFCFLSPF